MTAFNGFPIACPGPYQGAAADNLQAEFRSELVVSGHSGGFRPGWPSGGAFKYGDVGRMTEADVPKLRAATDFMASGLAVTGPD